MISIDSLNDYHTNPSLNTDIAGTDININCPPQDVGVYMRTAMAQLAYAVQGSGGAIPATWNVGTLIADTLQGVPVVTTDGITGKEVVNFSQFDPNLAFVGHIKLPGGITLQWGNSSGPTATVTFDVPFAGVPYTIQCTLKDAPAGGQAVFVQVTTTYNASGFTAFTISGPSIGVAANFFWFAIGPT